MLNQTMLIYFAFYVFGLIIGIVSPTDSMKQSLGTLEAITLSALVASLLVPFAGFSSNERKQKFIMQYGIVPLFGLYSVLLYQASSMAGVVLFVCASSVHFAYWTSSLHSRNYRLKQFQMGFSFLPKTLQAIAMINGQGKSHLADECIVQPVLAGEQPDIESIRNLVPADLIAIVNEELQKLGKEMRYD